MTFQDFIVIALGVLCFAAFLFAAAVGTAAIIWFGSASFEDGSLGFAVASAIFVSLYWRMLLLPYFSRPDYR